MKQKVPIQLYLLAAQESQIIPNFYLSEPYLRLGGVQCWEDDGYVWLEADDWHLFPALPVSFPKINRQTGNRIWSDFDKNNLITKDYTYEFLDWEYVFNPADFLTMKGGKWEVFRKNSRKWVQKHPGSYYGDYAFLENTEDLLIEWLERKNEVVEDAELIANFVLSDDISIHRKFLYDKSGELMAINVWDENWMYINYRLCIVRENQDYLDEYARCLFYTDPEIVNSGKLVNDGGSLGNLGLEKFKDKMNPVRKRKVYSWIKQMI